MICTIHKLKLPITFILFFSLTNCATNTPREKTLIAMGVAGIAGGVLGAATTPDDENVSTHMAMWAGIGAATAGVASLFVFDSDKENKERERQIEVLHNEVAVLRGESGSTNSSKEIFRSGSTLEKDVPAEYRGFVKPGGWEIYQVDQWVNGGDHIRIHQDKIFKLEPPQINVGSN